jgi:ATP-dependent helicase HrpA
LPEKLARTLNEHELPALDRPMRFIVTRGARGAARASTLAELQEELDRPFTEKEIADLERNAEEQRRERQERKRERRVRDSGEKLKEHRKLGDEGADGRRQPKGAGRRFRPPGKPRGRRRRG